MSPPAVKSRIKYPISTIINCNGKLYSQTGATYTPEYYINMRTGTHYFPRGVSSVAIEQSRQKFGLNKIDESTAGEISSAVVHRRTESCDLNNSRNSVPNILSNGNVLNGHMSTALVTQAAGVHPGGVSATGLSPDLQRRLAMQNYKGLECKIVE